MYSEQDIARTYSYHELDKGRRYLNQGWVLTAKLSADGLCVTGRVQGSERRPYDVSVGISYSRRNATTTANFDGQCSCYLGGYCKHAVAVLLYILRSPPARIATTAPSAATDAGQTDKPVLDWLDQIEHAAATPPSPNTYPNDVRNRAHYVLAIDDRRFRRPTVVVLPHSVYLTKAGHLGSQVNSIRASNLLNGNIPKYYREIDKTVLSLLWAAAVTASSGVSYDEGRYPLIGALVPQILQLILESGRGRWQTPEGPVLVAGGPRPGHAHWETASDGVQRFRLDAGDSGAVVLPLATPWYLVPTSGELGPLEIDVPPHLLSVLLAAPAVPPPLANRLRRELERTLPGHAAALPRSFGETVTRTVAPIPCLRLSQQDEPLLSVDEGKTGAPHRSAVTLGATLTFDYDGVIIAPDDRRTELTTSSAEALVIVPRQPAAETAARRHLETVGFFLPEHSVDRFLLLPEPDDPHWAGGDWNLLLAFLHYRVPELRAAGWRIEIEDDIAWDIAEPSEDGWLAEVQEGGSGIDWFGLSLGVMIGGERIDLLPVLLPLLRALPEDGDLGPFDELAEAGGTLFAPIDGKRVLPLPAARIRPLLVALYVPGRWHRRRRRNQANPSAGRRTARNRRRVRRGRPALVRRRAPAGDRPASTRLRRHRAGAGARRASGHAARLSARGRQLAAIPA